MRGGCGLLRHRPASPWSGQSAFDRSSTRAHVALQQQRQVRAPQTCWLAWLGTPNPRRLGAHRTRYRRARCSRRSTGSQPSRASSPARPAAATAPSSSQSAGMNPDGSRAQGCEGGWAGGWVESCPPTCPPPPRLLPPTEHVGSKVSPQIVPRHCCGVVLQHLSLEIGQPGEHGGAARLRCCQCMGRGWEAGCMPEAAAAFPCSQHADASPARQRGSAPE